MATILNSRTLIRSHCVSVWVGDFPSFEAMDEYLTLPGGGFETDFALSLDERDMPEVTVEPVATPISELVAGFSGSSSFTGAVVSAAQHAGISSANTMMVFYFLDYDPARVTGRPTAPLRFLGVFDFFDPNDNTRNA
jgi:hypothetical protein